MIRGQARNFNVLAATFITIFLVFATATTFAEDGYRLWLRYEPLSANARPAIRSIVVLGDSATANVTRDELVAGCSGLLGQSIAIAGRIERDGAIVVGTPQVSPLIAGLKLPLTNLGKEGFVIRSAKLNGYAVTVIAANADIGALYGAFHFLRLVQTQQPITNLNLIQKPRLQLRMLNHWDNLDGSIERGYAGRSLWNWQELPGNVDPRLRDYARANASIGVNATALNNVNANAKSLSADYLRKASAIADVFRPYGIRVFLSARFSAPMELGGLKTADPLDAEVAAWWKQKADEIYALIPDFGGFLVKANSEGQPGPRTYNRDHVDGANMLASAVAPHLGIVVWRAFVYDMKDGYDRAAAAYDNLQPFDGKFAANVLLQVKNGPIDFQPREPFHPLFGAMPKTQVIPEFQITQEYLGQSNNFVFLAPMWREVLDADTYAQGKGSTVAKVVDGSLYKQKLTGIAGVANTGTDRNWTGQDLTQSNWYAFGRLAWNPDLSSRQIAAEWIRMTLTNDAKAVVTLTRIFTESHEAAVNVMTPLGLHHIMWGGHHYGPAPWWDREKRADWNPTYYHRADEKGLGFDRTATGSNSVSQYHSPVRDQFANLKTCPENLLVWFHHVPWDYRMKSGRIFWDELALHYQRGVDWVRATRKDWDALSGVIDAERHAAVVKKLAIQERDAVYWRDACLLYFQIFSKRPLPVGVEKPARTLDEYKAKSLTW
ncbi:MAG TPA: alpha-glucuronidase family glycosyl hydrolase [Blastocatellia bacterium]|nr:alpha-glucuronidase family glycosyl hydrolase [Blastocatellia bacterium]